MMAASRRLRRPHHRTYFAMHKDLVQGEHLRSDDHCRIHKIVRTKKKELSAPTCLCVGVCRLIWGIVVNDGDCFMIASICSTEQFDTTIYSGDVDVKYLFRSIGDKSLIYY